MASQTHVGYRVAIGVLLALCLLFGWRWYEAASLARATSTSERAALSTQERYSDELLALRSEQERLIAEVSQLEAQLDQATSWPLVLLSPYDESRFHAQGLSDPVADLEADLQRHPELIPFEPGFGGQVRIGPFLITSQWVVAGVGDGHKAMLAFLSYELQDGQIAWKLLAAGE